MEKIKQTVDERHALHGARTPQRKLKSRNSFLGTVQVETPEEYPVIGLVATPLISILVNLLTALEQGWHQ
jgi:hypothetical protein